MKTSKSLNNKELLVLEALIHLMENAIDGFIWQGLLAKTWRIESRARQFVMLPQRF